MASAPLFDMSKAQPLSAAQGPPLFDMSAAKPLAPTGTVGQRIRDNFAEGLGVTNDEGAKNFFEHPINTLMNSLDQQGHLALKAKAAYKAGDYKGALMYGLNYLAPFIGQQTAKAGEQLNQGDYAGGISRTLGAAVPIIAGSPEARAAAADAATTVAEKAGSVTPKQAAQAIGTTTGAVSGHGPLSLPAAYFGGKTAGAVAEGVLGKETANSSFSSLLDRLTRSQKLHSELTETEPVYPGAQLPANPAAELLQASALQKGGQPVVDPAAGLARVPQAGPQLPAAFQPRPVPLQAPIGSATNPLEGQTSLPSPTAAMEPTTAVTPEEAPDAASRSMNLEGPRTLSGESALRKILAGQDNGNLLKIAKSRGIDVTQESQLKAGVADSKLINKIIDDFSDDELDGIRSQFMENTRMGKHQFGDIGPEAWKTMGLQSYFPDVKIPAATLRRTQNAISGATPTAATAKPPVAAAPASADNLLDLLQQSVAAAKAAKGQ